MTIYEHIHISIYGCFSVSIPDTAMLASLVAASSIPVSLPDDKELELLLKNLRRAMSINFHSGTMHVD